MSPVRSLKGLQPKFWTPTSSDVVGKIVITADDATDYTVLNSYSGSSTENYTISANITRDVDRLGNFRIRLSNDGGRYVNKFNGGEVVKFYLDTGTATTLVFYGRIDNVSYGVNSSIGFYVDIDGRDYPEMIDKSITGTEAAATADISLAGILYEFYNDVTLLFWNGSAWAEATYTLITDSVNWSPAATGFPTTLINMTYQHRKGWSVITEILKRAGLNGYLEYDTSGSRWTLKTFVQEDIINADSNVAYGVNLLNLSEYGIDNGEIVNRAIVYGRTESDNILILKTENDTTSQSNLWIKDRIFNEGALETMDEVQDKVDFELSEGIDTAGNGRLKTLCLHTLNPGEIINISVPYCNIDGDFKVHQLTHNFGIPFTTSIEISKRIKTVKDLFIPKVNPEEFIGALANPNNMTDSYTIFFNEATSKITHESTEEISGQLRLRVDQISGTATSETYTADNNVTQCELRRFENYETTNDDYEVSNTGGATWETYATSAGAVHSFDVPSSELKFRILMSRTDTGSTSPAYESVCMLYK